MKHLKTIAYLLGFAGLIGVASWVGSQSSLHAAAGEGTLEVTINFEGEAPKMRPVRMNADPMCAQAHNGQRVFNETVVVNTNNTLKNTVVYLEGSLAGEAAPQMAVMDQNGCLYSPHVASTTTGQTVEIRNSDKTLHNVHTYAGSATVSNRAMFAGMPPLKQAFSQKGEIIKFKCDVHPWMTGYLFVGENPFHGVSDDKGQVSLSKVPAGTHTIKVWHEQYGVQSQQVTVTPGGSEKVVFTYKAS